MARFNEILVPRFNRALQKLTAIKGEAPAPQLSSDIVPVFPFRFGVEFRYLESWATFQVAKAVAAGGAATFGALQLRNPVTSQAMALVELASAANTLADTIQLRINSSNNNVSVDLATTIGLGALGVLDRRGPPQSSLVASFGTPAAGFVNSIVADIAVLAANSYVNFVRAPDTQFLLLPGDALEIMTATANQAVNLALRWKERFLEESERSLGGQGG